MFCYNCGTQLPDDATFCSKCGKPQKTAQAIAQPTESVRYDTCEIKWRYTQGFLASNQQFAFVAFALGTKGGYVVAESSVLTNVGPILNDEGLAAKSNNPALRAALEGVITHLTKEGWESVGSGTKWWNKKFRKPTGQVTVVPHGREAWETCEIQLGERNDLMIGAVYWFHAQALSPKAQYTAGKTAEVPVGSRLMSYPKSHDKKARAAYEGLIDELVNQGWEIEPVSGTNWWSTRLKRCIDLDWEECEVDIQMVKRGLSSAEFKFVAIVRKGPQGKYDAEQSPVIQIKGKEKLDADQSKTTPFVVDAFQKFMQQLTQARWESTDECGKAWWNKRFRRKVI